MAHTPVVAEFGQVYTFTNNTSAPFSSNQNGIPILDPGDTVSIPESKLKPFHASAVDNGDLIVSPPLPPDLDPRASSITWQDQERYLTQNTLDQAKDSLTFDPNAPTAASTDDLVEVKLQLLDVNGSVLNVNSDEEVDLSVDVGSIESVVGYVSGTLGTTGPIRAKVASGEITIVVTHTAAAVQTISQANPKTAGLTVTDTHAITYS